MNFDLDERLIKAKKLEIAMALELIDGLFWSPNNKHTKLKKYNGDVDRLLNIYLHINPSDNPDIIKVLIGDMVDDLYYKE